MSLPMRSRAHRNFGARPAAAMAVVFPSPSVPSPGRPPPTNSDTAVGSSSWSKSGSASHDLPNSEEEDPPVQGPLPFEPDDAPWKKSESGIRKFFRKLFSESNVTFLGSSPKRSLSSLSKMALSSSANTDTTV